MKSCERGVVMMVNTAPLPGPLCPAGHRPFKVPEHKPSDMDKKMLIWSGRFKTVDQIPEFVS